LGIVSIFSKIILKTSRKPLFSFSFRSFERYLYFYFEIGDSIKSSLSNSNYSIIYSLIKIFVDCFSFIFGVGVIDETTF